MRQADAVTFAHWGFDFLKYDWCSYGKVAPHKTLEDYQRPYRLMGGILTKLDRDVVFNMCQYGMADVWNWGAEVGGNLWRTTGDLGLTKASNCRGSTTLVLPTPSISPPPAPDTGTIRITS